MNYYEFLKSKTRIDIPTGISSPPELNKNLFDFQHDIVNWACKRGRAALFAGTGLGKSLMELSWAQSLYDAEKVRTVIFTPLAVAAQMKREANKFGIECEHVSSSDESDCPILITNYQKLDRFDMSKFKGVVLDESSILKNQTGHYRTKLIEICKTIPYRLAATATPSPNDYMELGNHSEFAGIMSYTDMLSTFFVHDAAKTQDWRLKGHAEDEFWKWMASWSVMLSSPYDLGYDGSKHVLPDLHQIQHTVGARYEANIETGLLFPLEARSMSERLGARRATIEDRVKKAIEIIYETELKSHMFSDKLAICGNQNTQRQDVKNINPTQTSGIGERGNQEAQKKINDTCKNITPKTKTDGISELQNNGKNSINQGETSINLTQSLDKNAKTWQKPDPSKKCGKSGLEKTTGLDMLNTMQCSENKVDVAKYAEQTIPEEMQNTSKLIIATPQDVSGDCYATHVTSELENLAIVQKIYKEPQSTLNIQTPWVIWCQLNDEQDAIAKAFGNKCFSIKGSDSEEKKEKELLAWINGERPILITKPSICGYGLNFQHCNHTCFVGLNDSFEQVFQAIRRFWRFGQTKEVYAHFIASEIEGAVVANIKRKELQCEHMMRQMVKHMADLNAASIRGATRDTLTYIPTQKMEMPSWI